MSSPAEPDRFRQYVRLVGWALIIVSAVGAGIAAVTFQGGPRYTPITPWRVVLGSAYLANAAIFLVAAVVCLRAARRSATMFRPGARIALRALLAATILVTAATWAAGASVPGWKPLLIAQPALMTLVVLHLTFRRNYRYLESEASDA